MDLQPTLRDATENDIQAVQQILAHYITTSTRTFRFRVVPVEGLVSTFHDIIDKQHLPYLVAELAGSVLGYAYASGFRSALMGYAPTVEISLFCRPDYRGKGLGGRLLDALIDRLRGCRHVAREASYPEQIVEEEVKQVLAVMSCDGERDLALRAWYVKRGFQQVGRLHQVGLKHGRR